MMTLRKYLAEILVGSFVLGGAGVAALQPKPITLDVSTAKSVVWSKPTTDAQWAEDVKKENFDIKSTARLTELRDAQVEKLDKEKKDFAKYEEMSNAGQDPVQYLYWEKRQQLSDSYPDMKDPELHDEALKAAQTDYSQRLWEIEKITQSIERANKELDMRKSGFVLVEGERPRGILGATVPPERIRHVND